MKQVYSYTHNSNGTIPYWVEDGGYYTDARDKSHVGVSDVPIYTETDGRTVLTRDKLVARVQSIHAWQPYQYEKDGGIHTKTNSEIETDVDDWLKLKGF
jgi:hypothetical protein